MHKANTKKAAIAKQTKPAPKKAPTKQPKRALKTKKVKQVTKSTTPVLKSPSPSTFNLFNPRRAFGADVPNNKPNNIKPPSQMTNEELEQYNNLLPSTTLTDQWDEQLDRLDADLEAEEQTMSSEVEEYIHEHGETPTLWSSPAAIQYNIFNDDPQFEVSKRLIGPPGTIEEPTMVFSPKPYRIVGCVGTLEVPHPLGWFSMEGYLKHMCPSCGQIFQLTNNPDDCDFSYVDKVDNMKHFVGH